MSGDQSAPVEPEEFPRPAENVEAGRAPGADDTVAEKNAAFATPAGQSAPDMDESTDTDASTAQVDEARQAFSAEAGAAEQDRGQAPAQDPQDFVAPGRQQHAAQPSAQPTEQQAWSQAQPGATPGDPAQPPAAPAFGAPGGPGEPVGPVGPVGFEYGVTSISTEGVIGALGAAAKPRHRALLGTGIGLGYAALATVAAFAVIAVGSPAPVTVAGLAATAAPVATASSAAPAAPVASPSPAASSAAPSTAPPTTATPTSTVTGHVSSGVHSGDLRFFLLPPPDGSSSVQGDPDGTTESLTDIVNGYGGSSDVKTSLRELDFKTACDRTYQDSSIGANVDIELIQLGGSSDTEDWLSGFSESGTGIKSISVPGESGARAWSLSQSNSYELVGAYRDGDVFFVVDIYGTQSISASDLASVIKAEHSRLANG